MKKMKSGLVFLICLAFIGGGLLYAENSHDTSRLRGRDITEIGKVSTIEGTLKKEGTEWVLLVSDRDYDIHLGPETYRGSKGFVMVEGDRAVVKGFLVKTDMAVMEIETNGKSIVLRDADGRPAWAGSRFARGEGSKYNNEKEQHDHNTPGKDLPKDLESLDNLGSL